MKFKTYDEWIAAGYHVRKGEKSHRRSFGNPVFSEAQVAPIAARTPATVAPRRNSYLADFPTARYADHQYDWNYEGSMEEQLGSSWDFRD